jgi:hypothetical protein
MTASPVSPFLQRAAMRDAAGERDEAINELARGVRAGDLASTRALGLRLLTGNAAPLMPAEGLRFIGEAFERGDVEVGARAAGVLALGVNQPPDWEQGLQWLLRSAAGGWVPAQRQLLALCEDREFAQREAVAALPDWRGLAAAVDLACWRRAPPREVVNADPMVQRIVGFLRPEVCTCLIACAQGRLERARVYDPARRGEIVDAHRSNTQASFGVDEVEFVQVLMQARIAAACGVDIRQLEAVALLHYSPGEQIAAHYDFVDLERTPDYAAEVARNGQRVITFLLYLNEDYEGGETEFPRLGLMNRGRTGDALFFVNALADLSPDKRTLHTGRPTVRGEKWVVSQFIRSRWTRP